MTTNAVLTILEARDQFPVGDAQVSSQEERAARNESTTREINEAIEQAHQAASTPDHVRIVCECGRLECDRVIAITIAEYESVRADPRQFAVARDHVMAEVERVIAETDRYAVVAKRPGTPAAVAIEEDPRGEKPGWGWSGRSSNQDPPAVVPHRLARRSTKYSPHPDSAPGAGRMDPATSDARVGLAPSRTCTMSRSPDQSAVTRIRSSRPSPACRTLLLTSSETSSWASKASGSGNWSWLRARRALVGAVQVGRRLKSRRRGVSGAVCWWCLATVTSSLPCLRPQGRGFPPEIVANQRSHTVATGVTAARPSGLCATGCVRDNRADRAAR